MASFSDRRLGRFSLSADAIESYPEVVRLIMGQCIVLEAKFRFDTEVVEYLALCPAFAELHAMDAAPEYDVQYDSVTEFVAWVEVGA